MQTFLNIIPCRHDLSFLGLQNIIQQMRKKSTKNPRQLVEGHLIYSEFQCSEIQIKTKDGW